MSEKENALKGALVTQTQGYIDISKRFEIWKNVCGKFNGKLDIKHNKTSEIQTLKLIIQQKRWELQITESDTKPLKVEVNFNRLIDFELIVGQEEIFEKVMKLLGIKEIQISRKEFDDKYFIKSNNEDIALKILTHKIADRILSCNIYSLSYTSDRLDNKSNLVSVIHRNIDTEEAFISIVYFFIELIENLKSNKVIE